MKFSPEVEQTRYKLYILCYLLMTEVGGLFFSPPQEKQEIKHYMIVPIIGGKKTFFFLNEVSF